MRLRASCRKVVLVVLVIVFSIGVTSCLSERSANQAVKTGPGHWNDPDILQVGNLPNPVEDRAHFSLWCILAAPLMAGNDLEKYV